MSDPAAQERKEELAQEERIRHLMFLEFCAKQNWEVVRQMVKEDTAEGDKALVNLRVDKYLKDVTHGHWTALHYAAAYEDWETVTFLLKHGADYSGVFEELLPPLKDPR